MNLEQSWSQEAEKNLLGGIIYRPEILYEIEEILSADDFYNGKHKIIYKTIIELQNEGRTLNEKILTERLIDKTKEKYWGLYISSLLYVDCKANLIYFANIVKDKCRIRKIRNLSEMIKATNEEEKVRLAVNKMQDILSQNKKTDGIKSIKDSMAITENIIFKRYKAGGIIPGYETGYTNLDKCISGLQGSSYYVIAGRPSSGKTAILLNIAMILVKKNITILYFSFEANDEEILNIRKLASELRINSKKIQHGKINEVEFNSIDRKIDEMKEYPFFVYDDPSLKILEIEKRIKSFLKINPKAVIFIDYLQQIEGGKGELREQQVAFISRHLKMIAMKYNIPVIAASQLSRRIEYRGKKTRPKLSDLRESGAIEQDADVVIFLYRNPENMYNEKKQEVVEVFIAKNRHGEIGKSKLLFHKEYSRYENYQPGEELPW